MLSVPIPPNERERLAVVHECQILDTPPEATFDRLVKIISSIFHIPVVQISIMDSERQWFKACYGLSLRQTPREHAFCAWTVAQNAALVVPDTSDDPRFQENPLVTGEPYIRFYAGYPLHNPHGYVLGTVCMIDHVPRQLNHAELEILGELAKVVEDAINLHYSQDALQSMRRWSSFFAETLSIDSLSTAVLQQGLSPYFFPIFEYVALGIAYTGLDGHLLAMNTGLCTLTGYQRDELRQRSFQEIIHPEDLERVLVQVKSILNRDMPASTNEIRLIRKNYSPIWVNMILSLIKNKQQEPLFFILTIEDIHKRKQAEQERRDLLIHETTARIESERVNEQLLVLQAITDNALAHLTLDKLFLSVLGKIRAIMRADNIAILLLDKQKQYLTIRAVQGIEEGVANNVRIPLGKGFAGTIAARGAPMVVNDHSTVEILNPVLRKEIRSLLGTPLVVNEQVIGVIHIGTKQPRLFSDHDINLFQRVADRLALAIERASLYEEEQRMHQEVQAHAQFLAQLNERQRKFISVTGHEFRTTLTSIEGFSAMLQSEDFTPEEVKDFAADIFQDSLRLLRMINDLLDTEKMRTGKTTLHLETFQLADVLLEQIERSKATTQKHTFRLILTDDLPAVTADRDKISQVIVNLLSNAVKYWPQGGEIVVTCQLEDTQVHLQIQDRGIGIPAEALTKIFDCYNRVDSEKTRYIQGTGLGLTIVKQIVEIHKGKVWAESPQGHGTIFHVVLPLNPTPDTPETPRTTVIPITPLA